MPNPLNPLDWLRSAQDWFTRTERSSGFRPYLIYFILCIGLGSVLLHFFPGNGLVELFALALIGIPAFSFIPLYAWKAERDPDFCRSETHIQRVKKIELEMMGNESKLIEGAVLEEKLLANPESRPPALESPKDVKGR